MGSPADRGGGGPTPNEEDGALRDGDVVAARGGGGSVGDAVEVPALAFLLTHLLVSGSYTIDTSSPNLAFIGPPGVGVLDLENQEPNQLDELRNVSGRLLSGLTDGLSPTWLFVLDEESVVG